MKLCPQNYSNYLIKSWWSSNMHFNRAKSSDPGVYGLQLHNGYSHLGMLWLGKGIKGHPQQAASAGILHSCCSALLKLTSVIHGFIRERTQRRDFSLVCSTHKTAPVMVCSFIVSEIQKRRPQSRLWTGNQTWGFSADRPSLMEAETELKRSI